MSISRFCLLLVIATTAFAQDATDRSYQSIRNSDLYSQLQSLGFSQTAGASSVNLSINLIVGQQHFFVQPALQYTVRMSKTTAVRVPFSSTMNCGFVNLAII